MKHLVLMGTVLWLTGIFADQDVGPISSWRAVQEKAGDAVVRLTAYSAVYDMLQPYRPPSQKSQTGTGFFINEQGDIITSAHVVENGTAVELQVPCCGKQIIQADIIGVAPEVDLALLRVRPDGLEYIKKAQERIPFLVLGDSDVVRRSDDVLSLGYPLGDESLKSTAGVVSSAREHIPKEDNTMMYVIQTSAPVTIGSSGGPLLNNKGEVIGMSTRKSSEGKNIGYGYALPVNQLKAVLPELYKRKIIRGPFLWSLTHQSTESLVRYLKNPLPGGLFVVDVIARTPFYQAGLRAGDMLYAIDNFTMNVFGEITVPWVQEKISMTEYLARIPVGQQVQLTVYRKGEEKKLAITYDFTELPAVPLVYPVFEPLDYEIIGGMVVMQLTRNHIKELSRRATGLSRFEDVTLCNKPHIVVTHIFSRAQLNLSRTIGVGSTINQVNGVPVATLAEFRKEVKKSATKEFLALRSATNTFDFSDGYMTALAWDKIIAEHAELSTLHQYPTTVLMQEIMSLRSKTA